MLAVVASTPLPLLAGNGFTETFEWLGGSESIWAGRGNFLGSGSGGGSRGQETVVIAKLRTAGVSGAIQRKKNRKSERRADKKIENDIERGRGRMKLKTRPRNFSGSTRTAICGSPWVAREESAETTRVLVSSPLTVILPLPPTWVGPSSSIPESERSPSFASAGGGTRALALGSAMQRLPNRLRRPSVFGVSAG